MSEMFTLLFRQSNAESKIPCTSLSYAPQNQLKLKKKHVKQTVTKQPFIETNLSCKWYH